MYNYLFFKSYQVGKRSKNFEDESVLSGVLWVMPCIIFNAFTIECLLDKLFGVGTLKIEGLAKWLAVIVFFAATTFYYSHKNKYKRIIAKYEKKELNKKTIHPIFICLAYYFVSFIILLVAGMYKNGDL